MPLGWFDASHAIAHASTNATGWLQICLPDRESTLSTQKRSGRQTPKGWTSSTLTREVSSCQGRLTETNFGRDHHPRCFTIWMAGGVNAGHAHGATDEFGYNVVQDPVHVHDLNATLLHALGLDHERLTYRYQGRDFRLTDVHGHVVEQLLS